MLAAVPSRPSPALLLTSLLIAAGCGGPPGEQNIPDAAVVIDAAPPPPDAQLPALGPSFVVDDLHIASASEAPNAFALLGVAINPQLQSSVADGTLLLGLEIRDLDDPAGKADPDVDVAMYNLQDLDADPSNNFDPDDPEEFMPQAGSIVAGQPTVDFADSSITASILDAAGVPVLDLLGGFPLPLHDPTIRGRLVSAGGDDVASVYLRTLENGRLRTAVPATVLAVIPNLATGTCPGSTMLDVLIGGCGFGLSIQPDVDIDGDGLESIDDLDHDGVIDQCTDGDGTIITGSNCPTDPAIADGYSLIFVIHGVRARILDPGA